jgi:hypothetical protein
MTEAAILNPADRRNAWLAVVAVLLVCWFLPEFIRFKFTNSTLVFVALKAVLPFAALPFLRKLWPKTPKRAFAAFYAIVNFTLLLALGFGSLWAIACAFHSGPCN